MNRLTETIDPTVKSCLEHMPLKTLSQIHIYMFANMHPESHIFKHMPESLLGCTNMQQNGQQLNIPKIPPPPKKRNTFHMKRALVTGETEISGKE